MKQNQTDDEVISAVEDFIEDWDKSFYTTEIKALQHWWKKCVDRKGLCWKINHIWQIRSLHNSQSMNFSAHPCKLHKKLAAFQVTFVGIFQCTRYGLHICLYAPGPVFNISKFLREGEKKVQEIVWESPTSLPLHIMNTEIINSMSGILIR